MDEAFGLDDLKELVNTGAGAYATVRGKGDDGARPDPSRTQVNQAPTEVQRPGLGGGGGLGRFLIPALAALVVGYLVWKGTGRPQTGILAAVLAALVAWFLFSRKPAAAAAA